MTLTAAELFQCCGSSAWVSKMLTILPVKDEAALLSAAYVCWQQCSLGDWLEAFTHHPQIGAKTDSKWTAEEQAGVAESSLPVLDALAICNQQYYDKFGYIFIVCATGKPAAEMLSILKERLLHDPEQEIQIAVAEQDKITKLRLQKLVASV